MLRLARTLAAVVVATVSVMADEMPKELWAHPHPLVHHTNRVERTSGLRLLKAAPSPQACYDLRDIDGRGTSYLSPVRNQNPYGTCWAFSSMVGIEYLMNRDEGIAADLSVNISSTSTASRRAMTMAGTSPSPSPCSCGRRGRCRRPSTRTSVRDRAFANAVCGFRARW